MATPPERWADAIQKQAYLFFSPEYPQSNQRLSLGEKTGGEGLNAKRIYIIN